MTDQELIQYWRTRWEFAWDLLDKNGMALWAEITKVSLAEARGDKWKKNAETFAEAAQYLLDNYERVATGELGVNGLAAALAEYKELNEKE